MVRLDTVESRTAAAHGTYFQITAVPSLAVGHEDGTLQVFVGNEKILRWFESMRRHPPKSKAPEREEIEDDESEPEEPPKSKKKEKVVIEEDDEPEPTPKPSRRKKSSKKERKKVVTFEEDEPDIEFLGDEPDDTPPPRASKSSKKKPSKMGSLLDQAKQMEKERQATLGYKEEDLPVHP